MKNILQLADTATRNGSSITAFLLIAVLALSVNSVAADGSASSKTKELGSEIPSEVQALIDGYVADSTGPYGFLKAQRLLNLDANIHSTDISTGVPVESYLLDNAKLDTLPDTADVNSVVVPAHEWYVPIYRGRQCIYHIGLSDYKGYWKTFWMSAGWAEEWEKIRFSFPEKEGVNPVLVCNRWEKLLHFPKKGRHNLQYMFLKESDDRSLKSARDYEKMDDSRRLFKSFKSRNKEFKQRTGK